MEELLAQLVEEVSVFTADRRRKEPIKVPRPISESASKPKQPVTADDPRAVHGGLAAAAMQRGAVQRG